MAMRNYGVESKGMLLKIKDFYDLCVNKRKYINDDIEILFAPLYEKRGEVISFEEIDMSDLLDISYNIDYATYYADFNGRFTLINDEGIGQDTYLDDEDIVIVELSKDNLFKCYKDFNEIYEELIDKFKAVGITIDKEYVKEHLGVLEGTIYC